MRHYQNFIVFLFISAFCISARAQPLKALAFTRNILYHYYGTQGYIEDDSIKIHNPNHRIVKLDSVEVWSESRASISYVSLLFSTMNITPVSEYINVYLPQKQKPIRKGIFTFASILNLSDRNLVLQPNGDAWLSKFNVDRCPACKQSAVSAILDTLRFNFIFHHSIGKDTILVITDNRIGVSIKSKGRTSSILGDPTRNKFDFLGRQASAPSLQSIILRRF